MSTAQHDLRASKCLTAQLQELTTTQFPTHFTTPQLAIPHTPTSLTVQPTGQGWLPSLEVENDRLRGELDALRQRAVSTSQHELRATNERLTGQLRELEKADKTRAQLGYEIADLKQQVDQLRRSQGKEGPANLRRQLKVSLLLLPR